MQKNAISEEISRYSNWLDFCCHDLNLIFIYWRMFKKEVIDFKQEFKNWYAEDS